MALHQSELGPTDAMWLLSGVGTGASRQSERAAAGAGRLQADRRWGDCCGKSTAGACLEKYLCRYNDVSLWHVLLLESETHSLCYHLLLLVSLKTFMQLSRSW